MFPSTSSTLLPQDLIDNLHYPRRFLLNYYHPQPTTPTSPPNYLINPSSRASFDANLVMVFVVLLCALICSLCINSLIKCVFRCANFITREPNQYIYTFNHGVNIGIDKRALRTFPMMKYLNDEGKIQVLDTECVICLSEFRKGDRLRILPRCNHGFHVKCIDKWLRSHSSCPTCRQSLVDTCQKIIGCDNRQTNSSSLVTGTGEMITISVMPLEQEDIIRNYRG